MKTKFFFASMAAAAVWTLLPVFGDSQSSRGGARMESSSASASMPDPGAQRRQYFGTVAEVNSTTRLLVVQDDSLGIQTLHADERTKIMHGDNRASWSDIRVGMMVDGVSVGAPGNAYAETINIGR
jgi:hypothetical protein